MFYDTKIKSNPMTNNFKWGEEQTVPQQKKTKQKQMNIF